ncbi:hypothetical protein [Amycolatopsis sp. NPDC051372]
MQFEQAMLSERIEFLAWNRNAIADYLQTVLSVKQASARARVKP